MVQRAFGMAFVEEAHVALFGHPDEFDNIIKEAGKVLMPTLSPSLSVSQSLPLSLPPSLVTCILCFVSVCSHARCATCG